jgi:hypothetical protein
VPDLNKGADIRKNGLAIKGSQAGEAKKTAM